ncbi:hypothetical protein OIV83_005188 [Microbotryomycetes sp. JL201]|nr:hypothetical protein OIV83_005188 [Microbotryomycetes sp. JL201]
MTAAHAANAIHEHPSLPQSYTVGSSGACACSFERADVVNLAESRYLQDRYGRSVLLRGVSLSGLNKLPSKPNGFTHLSEGFFDHEHVSFIDRPFPLDHAHEHLSRLRHWGLTFIRLVVCWEALEHEGPGIYDTDYMQYLRDLVSLFPKYGIVCYVDPHQDVWSRHTGGSGAPTWTLELAGFDIRNLKATGAAHAHNLHLEPHDPPPKVWPSGYTKLAAATMATVFWAGDTFAPKRTVARSLHKGDWGRGAQDGEQVGLQQFLQQSMIGAFEALATHLRDCDAVIGFEVMNEPHRGYIDLLSPYGFNFNTDLAIGYFPTALQSWALGSGHPVLIDHYGPRFPVTAVTHQVLLSPPNGRTAWQQDMECIWKQHGLWEWQQSKGDFGEAVSLRNEYFKRNPQTGKQVECDFYWPFCRAFSERMQMVRQDWNAFIEPIPNEFAPSWPISERPGNLVFAPHWYDLQALFSKSLGHMSANVQGLSRGMFLLKALYFGPWGLTKNYKKQIRNIVQAAYRKIGEVPIVLGETGVPFDLNGKKAFETGDYTWQERMMDSICSALEQNLVSYNLWHYNPLNEHEFGDAWNAEDFSIFSRSEVERQGSDVTNSEADKLNIGARALDGFDRPFACKVAGTPLSTSYSRLRRKYKLRYANPFSPLKFGARIKQEQATVDSPPVVAFEPKARETEIHLPRRVFGKAHRQGKLVVRVSDGEWKYDPDLQTLYILHVKLEPGYVHTVDVSIRDVSDGPMQAVMGFVIVLIIVLSFTTGLFDAKMPKIDFEHWGEEEL